MRKFALVVAAAASLTAIPAWAGSPIGSQSGITLAQLDLCVGPNCRDRDRDFRRFDRDYGYDRDWRLRRGDRGCRDVTIRERRFGEVVIRHERHCD
jgi:hypothetical protein